MSPGLRPSPTPKRGVRTPDSGDFGAWDSLSPQATPNCKRVALELYGDARGMCRFVVERQSSPTATAHESICELSTALHADRVEWLQAPPVPSFLGVSCTPLASPQIGLGPPRSLERGSGGPFPASTFISTASPPASVPNILNISSAPLVLLWIQISAISFLKTHFLSLSHIFLTLSNLKPL